jgi:hypothetical protein
MGALRLKVESLLTNDGGVYLSKKRMLISCCVISMILMGAYFLNIYLKDDFQEIEKFVYTLNPPISEIAHIEVIDNDEAIVFFESEDSFGNVRLRKNIFGWKLGSSSRGQIPEDYKLDWAFSNITDDFSKYTDLISGKILDPNIKKVDIVSENGKTYRAEIIEYSNGESLWFLMTKGEKLLGATITTLSSSGEIIEQITK